MSRGAHGGEIAPRFAIVRVQPESFLVMHNRGRKPAEPDLRVRNAGVELCRLAGLKAQRGLVMGKRLGRPVRVDQGVAKRSPGAGIVCIDQDRLGEMMQRPGGLAAGGEHHAEDNVRAGVPGVEPLSFAQADQSVVEPPNFRERAAEFKLLLRGEQA